MLDETKNNLIIDDEFIPIINVDEAEELKPIQKQFIDSYIKNRDNMPIDEWLTLELESYLPEKSKSEILSISDEIILTLKVNEEKKISLQKSIENGRSKESWFASEAQKATSHLSNQEAAKYLHNLDEAIFSANQSLQNTILTEASVVNLNPNLDGFIAEQYHAQTFNLNAEATGSQYRAKVLEPNGKGYTKNSVDIEIVDANGKVVKRYQSKYCKDADATTKAFENGDYRGQQKLVPEEQSASIQKKNTTVLEAPDGTTSNPLSKQKAKDLQEEAQSGNWNDLNWNNYKTKDLALGIGKQAGQAALMGAVVGVGFNIADKVWNGEEIDSEEVIETALASGADFGVKTATAGALKVGAEKGYIHSIPKGTPAAAIANIAHVAVENVKVIGKIASGKLTVKEGLEKMEETTVSTIAGISASTKGVAIGAAIGTVFGPVGTTIGGVVGGGIGYMAGSTVGKTITKGVQKIREKRNNILKFVSSTTKSIKSSVKNRMKSLIFG